MEAITLSTLYPNEKRRSIILNYIHKFHDKLMLQFPSIDSTSHHLIICLLYVIWNENSFLHRTFYFEGNSLSLLFIFLYRSIYKSFIYYLHYWINAQWNILRDKIFIVYFKSDFFNQFDAPVRFESFNVGWHRSVATGDTMKPFNHFSYFYFFHVFIRRIHSAVP